MHRLAGLGAAEGLPGQRAQRRISRTVVLALAVTHIRTRLQRDADGAFALELGQRAAAAAEQQHGQRDQSQPDHHDGSTPLRRTCITNVTRSPKANCQPSIPYTVRETVPRPETGQS